MGIDNTSFSMSEMFKKHQKSQENYYYFILLPLRYDDEGYGGH